MNKEMSNKIVNENSDYFKKRAIEVEDSLGIGSFLLTPIQRIFKYSNLFNSILKTLMKTGNFKSDSNYATKLGEICRTCNAIEGVIKLGNESVAVNNIQFEDNEIRIFCLFDQQFRKVVDVDITMISLNSKNFKGQLFIFDGLVIYTKYIRPEVLQYRGHYCSTELEIRVDNLKKFALLFSTNSNLNAIQITGPNVAECIPLLKKITDEACCVATPDID